MLAHEHDYQEKSFSGMMNRFLGIRVDKTMQRSNWARRPLYDLQIKYARLDTRLLFDAWKYIKETVDDYDYSEIIYKADKQVDKMINRLRARQIY